MGRDAQSIILMVLPYILQLGGLTFAIFADSYIHKKRRLYFFVVIILIVGLIGIDLYQAGDTTEFFRTLTSVYGYSARPALIVLFISIVHDSKKNWIFWLIVAANTLIYMTSFFSNIAFSNKDNHFERGPLGYTAFVVSGVLLVFLMVLTFKEYISIHKAEAMIPLIVCLLIVLATFADLNFSGDYPITFLTATVVSCCVFFYIWLHLQFVREHERAMKAEQRIKIMVSQIQPHFIYNTISTIQALCLINPEKASETAEKFGMYLRQNIDSLAQEGLIPFDKELEHTRTYADIEMMRFPKIKVNYIIEENDFDLPALTVQPMVENAIRHGVRIREEGRVTVTSRREGENIVITVEDNGKGFDPTEKKEDGREHIGLSNVQGRIEKVCGGTMTIESVYDVGTRITITIPVKKKSN